jgi:hypothetical protein
MNVKQCLVSLFVKVKFEMRYHLLSNFTLIAALVLSGFLLYGAFLMLKYELSFPPHMLSFLVSATLALLFIHWKMDWAGILRSVEEKRRQKKLVKAVSVVEC